GAERSGGMGIPGVDGPLVVTNSRGEATAAFRESGSTFANARPAFDAALGTGFAGWGASWVDLANSGRPDLVLAAGAIPVTNLAADAQHVRVLAPAASGYGAARGELAPLRANGRGGAPPAAGKHRRR